ncbi:MAG: restriction endonuclease subunit S, partial [Alphaproteobacteria bacterium]|nr:restriction endonuclease subunit S [Alphaproteobacteria bacterium]
MGVYSYLKFVRFKCIENWSVSHILGMNMGYNERYPLVSIGQIIKKSIKPIKVEDNASYKQITLKTNGGGAVLRNVKQGKNIGTKKQYIVSVGQFIMSKIDARNGAFGVVGQGLDGAIVTADFPVFDVDKERVLPEYLALISSTASFVLFAQSCSRGTTNRQRIDVNLFLSQKIPLPTLEEQQTLVSSYKNKIEQSERLEGQATQIEQSIENYLLSELGIKQKGNIVSEPPTAMVSEPQIEYVVGNQQLEDHGNTHQRGDEIKKEYKYLNFVRYKDIERWDMYNIETSYLGKYHSIHLSEVISKLATGTTPPTYNKAYFKGDIDFYTPTDITGDMYLGDAGRHISQYAVEDKKARLFNKGDLLFVGIGSTVGKVGLVAKELASSNQQITGITFKTNMILPEYAYIFM